MSKKTQFPLMATICTLIAFSVLIGLGTWQLQRMAWKAEIIERIEAVMATDPLRTPVSWDDIVAAHESGDFLRGHIGGVFLNDREMLVGPRTYRGLPGYHLITPFRLDGGQYVLVNRGWIPNEKAAASDRPESFLNEPTIMGGLFRRPDEGTMFTPDNRPQAGEWFTIDIDEMAEYRNLHPVAPLVLYVERLTPQPYNYPLPQEVGVLPPDNHFYYALFWYGMAGLLLVFFWLRFLKAA